MAFVGPLPPKEFTEQGDDGFTFLGPDDYVRLRLMTKVDWYQRRAETLQVCRDTVCLCGGSCVGKWGFQLGDGVNRAPKSCGGGGSEKGLS